MFLFLHILPSFPTTAEALLILFWTSLSQDPSLSG